MQQSPQELQNYLLARNDTLIAQSEAKPFPLPNANFQLPESCAASSNRSSTAAQVPTTKGGRPKLKVLPSLLEHKMPGSAHRAQPSCGSRRAGDYCARLSAPRPCCASALGLALVLGVGIPRAPRAPQAGILSVDHAATIATIL